MHLLDGFIQDLYLNYLSKVRLGFQILYKFIKKNNVQIIKFVISGLLATLFNFFVYNLIFLLFNNLILASLSGYFSGLIISFLFAKFWVFQNNSERKVVKLFFIFCLIYFFGALGMTLIIIFLNEILNNHKISWFFGTLFAAFNNYLGSKYLLFEK